MEPGIRRRATWRGSATLSRAGARPGPRLLLWPEAAITEPLQDERRLLGYQFDVLATRREVQRLLGPGDLLLTGGVSCPVARRRVGERRHQQRLRARPRRPHPRPLRQGASRPLWRISADAARSSRRSACRASRPATSTSIPGPARVTLDLPGVGSGRLPALLRDHLLGRGRRSGPTARTSCSIRPTTPGSAPGARPSISPRRGCARSRRACRSSAPRRPASRP